MKKVYWFRFLPNWYGICFTHKSKALFSIRNSYKKSLFLFNWYIYFIPKLK